jgi:hypothetical protein
MELAKMIDAPVAISPFSRLSVSQRLSKTALASSKRRRACRSAAK